MCVCVCVCVGERQEINKDERMEREKLGVGNREKAIKGLGERGGER